MGAAAGAAAVEGACEGAAALVESLGATAGAVGASVATGAGAVGRVAEGGTGDAAAGVAVSWRCVTNATPTPTSSRTTAAAATSAIVRPRPGGAAVTVPSYARALFVEGVAAGAICTRRGAVASDIVAGGRRSIGPGGRPIGDIPGLDPGATGT